MSSIKGVAPGFLLLPAREYEWKLKEKIEIRVPRKGKIDELLSEEDVASGVKISGQNDFSIFEDNLLLLWEIVRILFAHSRYPSLAEDEAVNIVALEFQGDEVVLFGEVIESV